MPEFEEEAEKLRISLVRTPDICTSDFPSSISTHRGLIVDALRQQRKLGYAEGQRDMAIEQRDESLKTNK